MVFLIILLWSPLIYASEETNEAKMIACVALSEAAIDEQDIKIHKIGIDSILSFDKTT